MSDHCFLYLEPQEHDEPWLVEVYRDPNVAQAAHPGDWHEGRWEDLEELIVSAEGCWFRWGEPNDFGWRPIEAYVEQGNVL